MGNNNNLSASSDDLAGMMEVLRLTRADVMIKPGDNLNDAMDRTKVVMWATACAMEASIMLEAVGGIEFRQLTLLQAAARPNRSST